MFSFIKSLPIQLVISIVLAFMLGSYLDRSIVSIFYTLSTCLIDILMFVLPWMIFAYIFTAITRIQQKSVFLILLIFLGITASNLLSISTAYLFSSSLLPMLGLSHSPEFATKLHSSIEPYFRLTLPNLVGTGTAMMVAVILGIALSFISNENALKIKMQKIISYLTQAITFFLKRMFIPLLPLYVFGFCLKLSYDQALLYLFQSYGKAFLLSLIIIWVYIPLIFMIAAKGNMRTAFGNLRKMLPAGLTGFSTMSSAATMPVTLKCTEETTKDKNFADLIIPTTANTHLLGDNITITIASLALMTIFGMDPPDLTTFAVFVLAYCMAALSCVGIPGGTVLIVLPVLQNFLGFTPEMLSAITTIYVLQDPFGTTANVIGNGGFALLIQRVFRSQTIEKNPLEQASQ
jgi:Na+/H+-dicarboxylate symporter